jgi:hypothetical protein
MKNHPIQDVWASLGSARDTQTSVFGWRLKKPLVVDVSRVRKTIKNFWGTD